MYGLWPRETKAARDILAMQCIRCGERHLEIIGAGSCFVLCIIAQETPLFVDRE